MFQGMFRKRGRPPEQLPIGGYDKPNDEETGQIPDHQLLEAPRQLPLPSVREFEQDVVLQQEIDAGTKLSVQPFSTQHVGNMSNSQDRRLALDPLRSGTLLHPRRERNIVTYTRDACPIITWADSSTIVVGISD